MDNYLQASSAEEVLLRLKSVESDSVVHFSVGRNLQILGNTTELSYEGYFCSDDLKIET